MKRKPINERKLTPRKLPPECLCCGRANLWATVTLSQQTSYRGHEHKIHAEVTQCRHCDAVITTAEQDKALLEKSAQAHSQWIKKTIQTSQKRLKLTHREFSAAVHISSATLSRALKAETLIDPSTEELLLLKVKGLEEKLAIKELLDLAKNFSNSDFEDSEDPDDPWTPPYLSSSADSNELALAA
ncbi:hypothetical protein JIN77_07295 [Verrucomicrobiaceae bacterium R5-34]|nr:hypothetical protein [Verrucomicrobiaceae bacterium R5-34]